MIQHIDNIISEHKFEGRQQLLELIESGNKDLVFERLCYHASNHHSPLLFYDVIAWLYNRIGEHDKELEYLQMMYEAKQMKEILYQIFNAYYRSERYDEALKIANQYIETFGSGKILRTKTLVRLSTPKEGLRIIDEALAEIDTYDNKYAEWMLADRAAQICYEQKKYKRALIYAERALSSYMPGKTTIELKQKIMKKIRIRRILFGIGLSILTLLLLICALFAYIIISGPVTDCDSCLNGTTP